MILATSSAIFPMAVSICLGNLDLRLDFATRVS